VNGEMVGLVVGFHALLATLKAKLLLPRGKVDFDGWRKMKGGFDKT
tara:strand:- start:356 stop:493 length:138 start_codon:yes stop_codon:yes gene_type:complete